MGAGAAPPTTTWGGGGGTTTWGGGGGTTSTWGPTTTTTWGGGGGTTTWGGGGYGGGTTGTWTTGTNTDPCGSPVLILQIGNTPLLCSDPAVNIPCGGSFGVTITVPPELQHPGPISLSAPGVVATFSETGLAYGANPANCPGGGGSFGSGVLTIVAIDAGSVTFSLSGTQPFALGAPSADGEFQADRCN